MNRRSPLLACYLFALIMRASTAVETVMVEKGPLSGQPISEATSKDCTTEGGTAPVDSPCQLPFKYNNKVFIQCTAVDHDVPWCYVRGDDGDQSPMFGECRCMRAVCTDNRAFLGIKMYSNGTQDVHVCNYAIDKVLATDPVDTEEFNRKCRDFCTKLDTTCVGKPFKDGNPFKDLSKDGPVVAPPVVMPPRGNETGNETAPVSTAAPSVATEVRVVYSCMARLSKPNRRYNGCSRAVAAPALYRWFTLVVIGCAFLRVV